MTLYTLLVSVSNYPAGINDLPGCANDIEAIDTYLREYADLNDVDYQPIPLTDAGATYKAVTEAFSHFEQAGPDDICLFYYTGHGSYVSAPEVFWAREPNKELQTLVLHDSRQAGGRDLLDKEIAYLLHKHTQQSGQVLVIADSCHSGTISREHVDGTDTTARTAAGGSSVRFEELIGAKDYKGREADYPPPRGHVALSACQPYQVALETRLGGKVQGVFTYYLLETMRSVPLSQLSYAELAERVRVRVRNRVGNQDTYTASYGEANMNGLFLNGQLVRDRVYLLHHDPRRGWFCERGETNGLAVGSTVTVLVGERELALEVTGVTAGSATIAPHPFLAPAAAPYPIVSFGKTRRPLPLHLDSALDFVTTLNLRNALKDNPYFRLVETIEACQYQLTVLADYGLALVRPGEELPMFEAEPLADDRNWTKRFVERLEKVANYERTLALAPSGRVLPLEACVEVHFEQRIYDDTGQAVWSPLPQNGTAIAPYTNNASGKLQSPRLRVRVRRKTAANGPLHVGGLLLTNDFGVYAKLLPVEELKPDAADYITFTDTGSKLHHFFAAGIGPELRSWGVTEVRQQFKLFISETSFSLDDLAQPPLAAQAARKVRKQYRFLDDLQDEEEGTETLTRWNTLTIPYQVYWPLDVAPDNDIVRVAAAPKDFTLVGFTLSSSQGATRSLTAEPPCPTVGVGLAPASLQRSRSVEGDSAPLDVLELQEVRGPERVSVEHPLRLDIPALEDGAIALAFDVGTGRYYPVGFPDRETGETVIHQLPPAQQTINSRSLSGSIRLFFRKVINDKLPILKLELNRLRQVDVRADFRVSYREAAAEAIEKEVAKSTAAGKPVALFVHGIIGDTTVAPGILARAQAPDGQRMLDYYGTLLTYDYENLKTELLQTAQDLQKQLEAVGLEPGHRHTLHVYSHSMGGLVSRCFIEQLRGKEVVQHLIQFGTPNGGSPYGTLVQYLTPLLTWGLGKAAAHNPLLAPLLGLRWFVGEALVTLKQMKTGSNFLKSLKNSSGRGAVPYSIVNGDIHRMPDLPEEELSLLQRVTGWDRYQDGVAAVFFKERTDIAVSVSSQQDIPDYGSLPEAIGCDHLSYFAHPASVAALEEYAPMILNLDNKEQ